MLNAAMVTCAAMPLREADQSSSAASCGARCFQKASVPTALRARRDRRHSSCAVAPAHCPPSQPERSHPRRLSSRTGGGRAADHGPPSRPGAQTVVHLAGHVRKPWSTWRTIVYLADHGPPVADQVRKKPRGCPPPHALLLMMPSLHMVPERSLLHDTR